MAPAGGVQPVRIDVVDGVVELLRRADVPEHRIGLGFDRDDPHAVGNALDRVDFDRRAVRQPLGVPRILIHEPVTDAGYRAGHLGQAAQEGIPERRDAQCEVVLVRADTIESSLQSDIAARRPMPEHRLCHHARLQVGKIRRIDAHLLVLLAQRAGSPEFARCHAVLVLEGAGEAFLRVVPGQQCDVQDAPLRAHQARAGVRQAARTDVALQGLVGDRLEDPLKVPGTQAGGLRNRLEGNLLLIESSLDEVDAALNLLEVLHGQPAGGVSKNPFMRISLPSAAYSPKLTPSLSTASCASRICHCAMLHL